ncbi:unnamed protein product, partial [Amoebophrya sp. A120]|eukprot:GSA120T00017172001.1
MMSEEPEAEQDVLSFSERVLKQSQHAQAHCLKKAAEYRQDPTRLLLDLTALRETVLSTKVPGSQTGVRALVRGCEALRRSQVARYVEENYLLQPGPAALQQGNSSGTSEEVNAQLQHNQDAGGPQFLYDNPAQHAEEGTPADPSNFTIRELLLKFRRALLTFYHFLATRLTPVQRSGLRLVFAFWIFTWLLQRRWRRLRNASEITRTGATTSIKAKKNYFSSELNSTKSKSLASSGAVAQLIG